MANHKSAKKRIRQTFRRRQVNKQVQSCLRTLEKALRQAIDKKDKNTALQKLKIFISAMDSQNLHKNKVSRKKSRLTLLVNRMR